MQMKQNVGLLDDFPAPYQCNRVCVTETESPGMSSLE